MPPGRVSASPGTVACSRCPCLTKQAVVRPTECTPPGALKSQHVEEGDAPASVHVTALLPGGASPAAAEARSRAGASALLDGTF